VRAREDVESRFAFTAERTAPMTTAACRKMFARTGESSEFLVHPHRLRHACGYKLANDGQDTREDHYDFLARGYRLPECLAVVVNLWAPHELI
jgi:integrase